MPVDLPRHMEDFWLDPTMDDLDTLASVLTPYSHDAMEAYEVSSLVNSAANEGPEVIAHLT